MFDPVYLFVYPCVSYIHIPQLKNILTESQLGFKFKYLRIWFIRTGIFFTNWYGKILWEKSWESKRKRLSVEDNKIIYSRKWKRKRLSVKSNKIIYSRKRKVSRNVLWCNTSCSKNLSIPYLRSGACNPSVFCFPCRLFVNHPGLPVDGRTHHC